MPTFDGGIQVRTRVRLDRDSFQPGMGSLVGSSWTEEAQVHGTQSVSVDDDALHTYWTNLQQDVIASYTLTDMTFTHTTKGNSTVRVTGTHSLYVTTMHRVVVNGPSTYVYIGPHQDILSSQRSTAEPVHWFAYEFQSTKITNLKVDLFNSKNEAGVNAISAVAMKTDVNIVKNGLFAFKNENKGVDVKNRALSSDIKALGSHISALANKLGGLRSYVTALKAKMGFSCGPNANL